MNPQTHYNKSYNVFSIGGSKLARKRVTPLSTVVDRQLYIAGKNRYDLAKEVGVTYQYLSNILAGRTALSINMSKQFGKVLKMKDEELRRLAIQYEHTA